MVMDIKIGDKLYYLDRTHGVYTCNIRRIVETNGVISYVDSRNIKHSPEDLYYSMREVVEKIPTSIKYTDILDLPSGTKDFKCGDKVYFVDINPYMIHDTILTFVEKNQSYAYEGYCYNYGSINQPFATLVEAKESIKRGKDGR